MKSDDLRSGSECVRDLQAVLSGDASRVGAIRHIPHSELMVASRAIGDGPFALNRRIVLRVLTDWRAGRTSDDDVRWWALLVRVGGFPQKWSPKSWHFSSGGMGTVQIDYPAPDDEDLVEVIARLTELGDEVDGVITREERDEMIDRMRRPAWPESGN